MSGICFCGFSFDCTRAFSIESENEQTTTTTSMKRINIIIALFALFASTLWATETYAPPTYRGKVILVVDRTMAADFGVNSKIERLTQDLVGDGWRVLRHDVERGAELPNNGTSADFTRWAQQNASRVREVRALIKADNDAAPDEVKNVFLIGHVPVPYSGQHGITGANGGHYAGAQPADAFYGDVITPYGALGWSDSSTESDPAAPIQCHNLPSDGKFDQSIMPSPMKLGVGRLDLSRMPAFAMNEATLISRYLDKDHDFRCGNFPVQRRALLGEFGGPFQINRSGLDNIFGANNVFEHQDNSSHWFPYVSGDEQDYLLGYGGGWGYGAGCAGIGNTSDFVNNDSRVVFVNLYGSFFGNWEELDDFLKAPLANPYDPANDRYGYGLDVIWADIGLDAGTLTKRALGATIGEATFRDYYYIVNFNLMGDPTLRMHTVRPPTSPTMSMTTSTASLTWTASPDATEGYNIYRAPTSKGPYFLVNIGGLVTGTSYSAARPTSGDPDNFYMVRAVKTEITPVGSYANMSEGAIIKVTGATTTYLYIQNGPASQSVLVDAGDGMPNSAVFTADAMGCDTTGNEQIFYQWYKNGVPLSDGDCHIEGVHAGSLLIKEVQTSDAGSYSVVVSNSKGTLTSSTALLTVNPPLTTAVADTITVIRNTPTDLDVLANDSPGVAGSTLNFISSARLFWLFTQTYPNAGTLNLTPDQQAIRYTPPRTWLGQVKFTYIITDGTTFSQPTEVTLNVVPASANPPVISSIANQQFVERTTVDIPFTVSDDFTLPDDLKYTIVYSNPSLATSITGTGANRVLHITGFQPVNNATVTLTFSDDDLNSASVSFQVTVAVDPNVPSFTLGTISGSAFTFTMNGPSGSSWSLYQSSDLKNWTKVGEVAFSGIAQSFTDNGLNGVNYRFYRLSNGTDCSPPFGFERLAVTPGYTAIANQLDAPMNTLDGLFNLGPNHTMPDGIALPVGTQIGKDNAATYTWTGTGWLNASGQPAGNTPLSPGEGAMIFHNPNSSEPVTVTFVGVVREGQLSLMLNPGSHLVSSMLPQHGSFTELFSYSPKQMDTIQKWTGSGWVIVATYYDVDPYDPVTWPAGWYGPDDELVDPIINVGEAFGFGNSASSIKYATQNLDPCSGNIAPGLSNGQLSSGTFSFNISGQPNASWNVYSSTDLKNWTQIGGVTLSASGTGIFADGGAGSTAYRFYRLGNENCCSRVMGFTRLTAAPGYTAIANQFDISSNDDPAQNTLTAVFAQSSLPAGTVLCRPNNSYTWNGSAWSGSATFSPGEGAFIQNNSSSSFTVTFVGYVRQGQLSLSLPPGNNLVSSLVPQAGPFTQLFSYSPQQYDTIWKWTGAGWYMAATYYDADPGDPITWPAGWYGPNDELVDPMINVGESFSIGNSSASTKYATQYLDPCSGKIVPGLSNGQLSSGTFSFSASGVPNTAWTVYSSTDLEGWTQVGTVTLNSSGAGSFSDSGAGSVGIRFYRLSDEDYCSRVVGFYQLTIPSGDTPIANQLDFAMNDDPALNTLANVFGPSSTSLPNGTVVTKGNTAYTWNNGIWSGSATVSPGDGIFIHNTSPLILKFVGYVREGLLSLPIGTDPAHRLSSMVPQSGRVMSDLGYQPTSGDVFWKWNPGWSSSTYLNAADATAMEDDGTPYPAGWYDPLSGDHHPEPTYNVGETLILDPAQPGEIWSRTFNTCSGQ
jgi:hypothetical protein